jgi:hypothetical protein
LRDGKLSAVVGSSLLTPRRQVVPLDFHGDFLQGLVWALLAVLLSIRVGLPVFVHANLIKLDIAPPWSVAYLSPTWMFAWLAASAVVLAGPWILEFACRSFCRSLEFGDGSAADFSGRGSRIVGWWLLCVLAGHRWGVGGSYWALVEAALYFLGVWGSLNLLRWFVRHVELSAGDRLDFHGTYLELAGWQILLGLSVLTVIGWAWVMSAIGRWLAGESRGGDVRLRFHASGGDMLGHTLAALCFSIPIVTIPWAWTWYARFLVRNITKQAVPGAGVID